MMASNIQRCRGHDHQFAEQPPDDLHCIVCLTVAKDPQQMNCCGKMLCKSCLDDWSRHSNSGCPQCRVKIISFDDKRSKYVATCYNNILIARADWFVGANSVSYTSKFITLMKLLVYAHYIR